MQENTIEDKLTVFISSKINDRYNIVRKALKRLLLETGMFASIYAFETEGARSKDVKSAYLGKVDTSDICVFLIDNYDKVSDSVMAEHIRAKNANIHRLYFFCDEKEKSPTSLQNELMISGEVKYYDKIHEFSDFPTEAYKSVMRDIIDDYKGYKQADDTPVPFTNNIIIPSSMIILRKDLYKSYSVENELTNVFNPYHQYDTVDTSTDINEYDRLCSEFLSVILGKKSINSKNYQQLKSIIIGECEEEFSSFIGSRLDAILDYFLGDIEKCLEKLNYTYEMIKNESNIPQWLKNDVIVDILNVEKEINEHNNIFFFESDYQKILKDNQEAIYYPLLDRYVKNSNDMIIKEFFAQHTKSPYSFSFSNPNIYYQDIASAFNISVRFGSISHILNIRKNYGEILFTLFSDSKNVRLFITLITMQLLLQDDKQIKKIIDSNKQSVSAVTAMDINAMILSINTLQSQYKRSIAHCLLLEYFGYYFNDDQYTEHIESYYKLSFNWCNDEKKIITIGNFILKTLKNNIRRIDNQKAAELIICFFENHLGRYYREVLQTAYYLDFSKVNTSEQVKIIGYLIDLMKEENFPDKSNLQSLIIQLRLNSSTELYGTVDDAVKTYMSEFFYGEYDLEIFKKNSIKHVFFYLDIAEQRNKSASINKYSSFLFNPFNIILNIIKNDCLDITFDQINKILIVIEETLINKAQQSDQKISAIHLLIYLKGNFQDYPSWATVYQMIVEKSEDILNTKSINLMKTSSRNTLLFNMLLMKICFDSYNLQDAAIGFASVMSYDEFDFITTIESTFLFLQVVKFSELNYNTLGVIVNFILSIAPDRHKDIQYYTVKCMILLSKDETYGTAILDRLAHIMDVTVSEIKLSILYSIKESTLLNSDIEDYIMQKGRTDNHYLVRKIAEEISTSKLQI